MNKQKNYFRSPIFYLLFAMLFAFASGFFEDNEILGYVFMALQAIAMICAIVVYFRD